MAGVSEAIGAVCAGCGCTKSCIRVEFQSPGF